MNHQDPRSLGSGFLRSALRFPDRPALESEGRAWSYGELRDRAAALAATVTRHAPVPGPELAAVFAYRSPTAYAGILGALLCGRGYVPLNRTFPPQRTRAMLQRSGSRVVILDTDSARQLEEVLAGIPGPLLLVLPDVEDVGEISSRWPEHRVLGGRDLEPASAWRERPVDPDAIAYLLFTSGSTGEPKGVMVAHRNVLPFLDFMTDRYDITEADRFSQTFDPTFDLSVFDMFVAWERGACVVSLPEKSLVQPGKYVRDANLTVWFSVPSVAIFMKRLGALKPGRYPKLRWSLFCGEPLPMTVAQAWAEAAPGSVVENLYGPTEATIACLLHRWDPERSPSQAELGIVPIGAPYPGMSVRIVDDRLREVEPGEEGELLLGGPQVSPGYWNDPGRTAASFLIPPGSNARFYRTGDIVRRPVGDNPIVYLRRADHQVKVQGHRVELGEIEAVLREESGLDGVVALGWPLTESGVAGVIAFLEGDGVDPDLLTGRVAARLPSYMVPRRIVLRNRLPVNANGKFDRRALLESLEAEA